MSDLCHNCGDCHLGAQAIKCRKELQECIICRSFGHTYNFCPRSVHQLDEKYSYFMLCHNCDSWHLPNPCEKELQLCERCQQYGHMVFFCPTDPEPRARTDEQVGAKRQRGLDGSQMPSSVAPATEVQQVHPQLLRDIKLYAAKEAFQLSARYSEADVLQYFARPVLPPLQTMTGPVQHATAYAPQQYGGGNDSGMPGTSAAADHPRSDMIVRRDSHQEQHSQGSPTILPTPASVTDPQITTSHERTTSGVYQTMHDRFERGELAMAQDEQEPRSDSTTQSPATGSVDAQPTSTGKKKSTPKPRRSVTRCAPCKKRHMKCKHFDENGNPTGAGVQPAAAGSVSELPSGMDLVYEPSIGHLVPREEQDTIRVGNGQMKMQDHIVASDQAMMGELPEFDQTRRSYQGGINQIDWLDKSSERARSALVVNDQGSAMMPESVGHSQQWMSAGGMLPAVGMYGDQSAQGDHNEQLERNLAQMLSEEAGFGLPAQSTVEPAAFGGDASVAFMGTGSPFVAGADSEAVAKVDGTSNGTPDVEASVTDLVELPKKKKAGGRKRSKAA